MSQSQHKKPAGQGLFAAMMVGMFFMSWFFIGLLPAAIATAIAWPIVASMQKKKAAEQAQQQYQGSGEYQ